MKHLVLILVGAVGLALPATALAQRGGFGGVGGMGGFGPGRFDFPVPDLPGPELEGPLDSARARGLLGLNQEQAGNYAQAYDSFMVATRQQRDSARKQLDLMQDKLDAGDRAAAVFYAERAQRLGKELKDRQNRFEDRLPKILSNEQIKAYRKWKKEQEQAAEERRKEAALDWRGGERGGLGRPERFPERPLDEKARVDAPVGGVEGTPAAVRVGRMLFVSGQVAVDSAGQVVGGGDLRAQTTRAFANLGAVLRAVRALPEDVVRLTVYVVNYRPDDLAIIRETGAAYLPEDNAPAMTVVGVQSLYREGLLVAVDAIAVARGGAR
ncbi:MAG: RidA family protein [Gemmatimonadetes bacterium]|nr:RidA family protein [Gemmatimonadota bacterium]